jgi:hypothetical protein
MPDEELRTTELQWRWNCMAESKRKKSLHIMMLAGMGTMAVLAYKPLSRRIIEARARKELEKRCGGDAAKRILVIFREEHEELLKDGRKAKGIMRFHLASARQGLALYRALVRELGEGEDVVDAAHQIIWEAYMKPPSVLIGYVLGRCKDPFKAYSRGVALVNAHIFPPPGWSGTVVEVEGGIGFDYTSCFYNDYLREKGAPELTPIFCKIDVPGGISATSASIAEIKDLPCCEAP